MDGTTPETYRSTIWLIDYNHQLVDTVVENGALFHSILFAVHKRHSFPYSMLRTARTSFLN